MHTTDPLITDPRLAAAAWTRIAEPTDAAALALIGALGPAEAWHWLVEGAHPGALTEGSLSPAARRVLQAATKRWLPRLTDIDPARDLEHIERLGGCFLIPSDPAWPSVLDADEQAPWGLWVRGNPDCLEPVGAGGVAMVGARAMSHLATDVTAELTTDAASFGIGVISGAAYGVDAVALRAALAAEVPVVAVVASGLDRWYPAQNVSLFEWLSKDGAIVSAYPPRTRPARWRFLDRNKLIATLSVGTVVVEASVRSGALNTAAHARALSRHLGAVPGPILEATHFGSNRLLREGAVAITSGRDIAEMIRPVGSTPDARLPIPLGPLDGLSPTAARTWDALPVASATTLPSLVRASGLATSDVLLGLAELEMAGRVEREGTKYRRAAVG